MQASVFLLREEKHSISVLYNFCRSKLNLGRSMCHLFLKTTFAHRERSTFMRTKIVQSSDLYGDVDHPIGVQNHQKEIS